MKKQPNQSIITIVSTIPLFFAVHNIWQAIFLSSSILVSVLSFEILFLYLKRFPRYSILFALIVTTVVLKGIFLIIQVFSLSALPEGHIFQLTAVSAFLLSYNTMDKKIAFARRLRNWIGFFAILLVIGISRHWSGPFQTFLPAPFWISGFVFAAFFWLEKRRS